MKQGETTVSGSPAIVYYLVAYGLSKDVPYHLWTKTLSNPTPGEITVELKIDQSGYVVAGDKRIELRILATVKGEATEFALMTLDKAGGAIGKVIPNPIEAKQAPYRLWVELGSKTRTLFFIYGEGFEPNEGLRDTSSSEGEVAGGVVRADDHGRLVSVVLPAVVGKVSGTATYTVIGKQGTISISYTWGVAASEAN